MFISRETFQKNWNDSKIQYNDNIYKLYRDFFNPIDLTFSLNMNLMAVSKMIHVDFYNIVHVVMRRFSSRKIIFHISTSSTYSPDTHPSTPLISFNLYQPSCLSTYIYFLPGVTLSITP